METHLVGTVRPHKWRLDPPPPPNRGKRFSELTPAQSKGWRD